MSKVNPVAIADRPELNLRQGIKSSLNSWRQLLSSLYLFYLYASESGDSIYGKEKVSGSKTTLVVSNAFTAWLNANWGMIPNVVTSVGSCPLFAAQMEHLQVGLELFLRLAKVEFVNGALSDATERTGGSRYLKRLKFSTNMMFFADTISAFPQVEKISFVEKWLGGRDDGKVSTRAKEVLLPFTEECQYKIRTAGGEIYFQQDGVYECLKNVADSVQSSDAREPVGPFRILKSYVKEGMHPFIEDSDNGFKVKAGFQDFLSYADKVKTTLLLTPKRTVVVQEVEAPKGDSNSIQETVTGLPWQLISYGAPGTGKSRGVKMVEEAYADTVRTTFHPDTDYASFVGCYKPMMCGAGATRAISYEFVPQAFAEAYVLAWRKFATASSDENAVTTQFLVVEEINRGNCAQIFGDLFQLLDRRADGYSEYPINADRDLSEWLQKSLSAAVGDGTVVPALPGSPVASLASHVPANVKPADWAAVLAGKKLMLPPNLHIWATMNTSDQSLFPMDSAFKRRWEWKYVPIAKPDDWGSKPAKVEANGVLYDWWDFISIVNAHIADVTKSEDKQLGYFFAKSDKAGEKISAMRFANKVLFYLFNDVFKDWDLPAVIFGREDSGIGKYSFKDFFFAEKTVVGDRTFEPGEVREDVVAKFIEHQKWDGLSVGKVSASATSDSHESSAVTPSAT